MLWHNPLIDLFISFIGLIFIAQGAAKNALVYTENTRWLAQQHHWLAIASLLREGAGESERERGGREQVKPLALVKEEKEEVSVGEGGNRGGREEGGRRREEGGGSSRREEGVESRL